MASTLSSATMTVRIVESIKLNGTEQGAINTRTISSINEISKRILTVPTSETVVTSFSTAVATGTFIEGDVRYVRITNKDDTNFVYLVFKNEYSNEFCIKLDSGQSYIYNGDNNSGVIDTMLANQVPFGFTTSDGTTTDASDDVTSITATNKIIPGLRFAHDNAAITAGTSVGTITGGDAADGYRVTAHTLVARDVTTGAETAYNVTGHTSGTSDSNGTGTYSVGFGDLVEITAEADTASVDLEIFIASV